MRTQDRNRRCQNHEHYVALKPVLDALKEVEFEGDLIARLVWDEEGCYPSKPCIIITERDADPHLLRNTLAFVNVWGKRYLTHTCGKDSFRRISSGVRRIVEDVVASLAESW